MTENSPSNSKQGRFRPLVTRSQQNTVQTAMTKCLLRFSAFMVIQTRLLFRFAMNVQFNAIFLHVWCLKRSARNRRSVGKVGRICSAVAINPNPSSCNYSMFAWFGWNHLWHSFCRRPCACLGLRAQPTLNSTVEGSHYRWEIGCTGNDNGKSVVELHLVVQESAGEVN